MVGEVEVMEGVVQESTIGGNLRVTLGITKCTSVSMSFHI